jgi:hypothetical protein
LELEQVLLALLQIVWGKEHLIKNRLISTPDKVIYFKGTNFSAVYKTLLTSQNKVEISKKILPFFKDASSSIAPKISMGKTV